ncbi:MAG: hypothetical protein IJL66_00335 [Lachnospiraceae bacterium]|nr:hypothetical protein [Lachnospiraceae bacterium]
MQTEDTVRDPGWAKRKRPAAGRAHGRASASLTAESAVVITLVLILLLGTVLLTLYEHDRVVLAVRLYEREMTGAEPRFLLSGGTQISLQDGRISGEHAHQIPSVPAVRDAVRSRAGTWPQAALVRLFSLLREELE